MAQKTSGTRAATIGAGLAATALAAAAGYYFYASEEAKQHRKKAGTWATSFKKEVLKRVRQFPEIDANTIERIVDEASLTYATAKNIDRSELTQAAAELKRHWDKVAKEARSARAALKRTKNKVKKAVKTVKKRTKTSSRSK